MINGTDATLADVNAGGIDVPKRSLANTITLDAAELAYLLTLPGVAVMADVSTYQGRRRVAKVLRYGEVVAL